MFLASSLSKQHLKKEEYSYDCKRYQELDKITLIRWVDKIIDQSLTKDNIRLGFKVTNILRLNPKATEEKTQMSMIYT
jgi:hypothetical protein